MYDNQLITQVISILNAGLTAQSITATVKQSYQPTVQGIPTGPTIFLNKVGDKRYGYPNVAEVYDTIGEVMNRTETQQYETTFQITALSIQDPSNVNSLTASDLVNVAAYIMNSADTITTLEGSNIGIYRITDVRNPYFQDDKGNNEASPSFDFTLTHKQVIVTTIPTADPVIFQDFPV